MHQTILSIWVVFGDIVQATKGQLANAELGEGGARMHIIDVGRTKWHIPEQAPLHSVSTGLQTHELLATFRAQS